VAHFCHVIFCFSFLVYVILTRGDILVLSILLKSVVDITFKGCIVILAPGVFCDGILRLM